MMGICKQWRTGRTGQSFRGHQAIKQWQSQYVAMQWKVNQSSVLPSGTAAMNQTQWKNLRNYRIQPNELKRVGSWKATAEQNVRLLSLSKPLLPQNRAATPKKKPY